PLRDGPAALVVAPRSLRAPGFRLLVGSRARALVEASPPPSRTYRGILMRPGRPDATAAATLEEGLLRLVVVEPDGSGFSVQPARDLDPRAPRARHVVLPNDGGGDANGTCSVTAA